MAVFTDMSGRERTVSDRHAARATGMVERDRERRRKHEAAFQAGLKGHAPGWDPSDEDEETLFDEYARGEDEARRREERSRSSSTRSSSSPRSSTSSRSGGSGTAGAAPPGRVGRVLDRSSGLVESYGADASGALFSLVAFCLAVNWLTYGWRGVTGWVGAKFWNHPMDDVPPAPTPTSAELNRDPARYGLPPAAQGPGGSLGGVLGIPAAPPGPPAPPANRNPLPGIVGPVAGAGR